MAKREDTSGAEQESGLRHPIHAAEHEVEHLRQIAQKGESAATPAIIGGTVIAFVALILAVILTLAIGIGYLATRCGGGGSGGITTAPAFSTDELAALPTENWITNGGSLANQRYSPLDQIDVSNVSQLKGVWHIHLSGLSRLAAKYSAEAQPVLYVFVGRSNGNLLAYDARSGKQLWSFQTGAGANNAPTFFERSGKQYVAFYAGGNALAASPHGDDLWLFGLDGTLGPARRRARAKASSMQARRRRRRRAGRRGAPQPGKRSSRRTAPPATAPRDRAVTAVPT
jgi:outer membrane protein assembly factor BamB